MIPKEIRDRIGIRPGDEVSFDADDDEVRVRRVTDDRAVQANRIKALRAIWNDGGGTDALTEERRGEREGVSAALEVIDPDWTLVVTAASIKARGGLSYADAFCIATALDRNMPLWTGDPEVLAPARDFACEVVDLRS